MRLVALALTIMALAVAAEPCQADGFRIEAESFIDARNTGNLPIALVNCTSASGRRDVQGVDSPGDWIELRLELRESVSFVDSLRSAGLRGEQRMFSVLFLSTGDPTGAPGDTVISWPGLGFS